MQRNNSGFYAMAAVLLTAASFLYAWKFVVPDYQKNLEGIERTNKEIDLAKVKLESLQKTKNSLNQLGDVVDKLFLAVPADKDAPNLITELEAIATKYDTIIPSIEANDSTGLANPSAGNTAVSPAPSSNAIMVSFSVQGSFENLNKMISTLENDIRFTNIKSLTFAVTPDNKETSLAIQMEVYKRGSSSSLTSSNLSAATPVTSQTSTKEVQ